MTGAPAETQFSIPADVAAVYSALGALLLDLTDAMAEDVKEWRSDLRQAIRDWKAGGDEPDWPSFRDSMNDICHDDGMPALFTPETEADPHPQQPQIGGWRDESTTSPTRRSRSTWEADAAIQPHLHLRRGNRGQLP